MLMPDFTRYSLALLEGGQILYCAGGSGLRPLWDALEKFQGRSGLILHDKVIGLAAAMLIVRAGIIVEIHTKVASRPAVIFLEKNGIILHAADVTANILTRDQSAICPGEIIALGCSNADEFMKSIREFLGSQAKGSH